MGKRKEKLRMLPVILLILGAVSLLLGREIRQTEENQRQIEKMETQISRLNGEALARQRNLAAWYNYNLDLGTPGLENAYHAILDFGDGAMAALEVPEMNLRLPVFHGGNGIAGHLPDSDFPVGIRGSHTVLNMGEWYPWKTGMAVYIDCLGSRGVYQVESIQVMPGAWPPEWPSEQERLTILYDRGGLRTMIRCVRCGELTVRKAEDRLRFGIEGLAALLLLPVIFRRFWMLNRNRRYKYPGFHRKNRRKSKLLRNYGCKFPKIDV